MNKLRFKPTFVWICFFKYLSFKLENTSSQINGSICPSCGQTGTGEHCTHCSEVMNPRRITMISVFKSIPDVFFDVEHGLFYTIKSFFKQPGETIRRYFNGDRQRHYKPLKFVLFIGGLYAFLFISFGIHGNSYGMYEGIFKNTATGKLTGKNIDQFVTQWTSVIVLMQFPVIAMITWLVFKKRKYYFGEHLVANAYFITEAVLYKIIFFPVYYLANGTKWIGILDLFYTLWIFFYYSYAFYDWFYFRKTTRGLVISIALIIFLFLLIQLFTLFLGPVLYYVKVSIWGS